MKNLYKFTLSAGQKLRVSIKFSGWTPQVVQAAVLIGSDSRKGRSIPMESVGGLDGGKGYRSVEGLPVGLHLLEIRVDGVRRVYEHIDVQPSPLEDAEEGIEDLIITLPQSLLASITIIASQGPAGPEGKQGPAGLTGESAYQVAVRLGYKGTEAQWLASLKGDIGQTGESAYQTARRLGFSGTESAWIASLKGDIGQTGESAYQTALRLGFSGSESEWVASLKGEPGEPGIAPTAQEVADELVPKLSTELSYEGPAAASNWHACYFQIGSAHLPEGIALSEFGYRVRFDSINGCSTEPLYLGIWELSEDSSEWIRKGVSLNTQVQSTSADVIWQFNAGQVKLSGRPIKCCLLASPDDDWRTDLIMGMRTSSSSDTDTKVFYNDQQWNLVPKFFLRGYKLVESVILGGGGGGDTTPGPGCECGTMLVPITEASQKKEDAEYSNPHGQGFSILVTPSITSKHLGSVIKSIEVDMSVPNGQEGSVSLLGLITGLDGESVTSTDLRNYPCIRAGNKWKWLIGDRRVINGGTPVVMIGIGIIGVRLPLAEYSADSNVFARYGNTNYNLFNFEITFEEERPMKEGVQMLMNSIEDLTNQVKKLQAQINNKIIFCELDMASAEIQAQYPGSIFCQYEP